MKSILSALLFDKLWHIDFYRALHQKAIDFGLDANNGSFLDVGCGPGFAAIYTSKQGRDALGLDINPESIKKANKKAALSGFNAVFKCKKLENEKASIVFAASYLAVLEDRQEGLRRLFDAVENGGALTVVEPTKIMNLKNARKYAKKHKPKGAFWLYLWAIARQNNIVDERIFETMECGDKEYLEIMDGLIGVWKMRR